MRLSNKILAAAIIGLLPMAGAMACTTGNWTSTTGAPIADDPDTNATTNPTEVAAVTRYSGNCGLQPAAGGNSFVTTDTPAGDGVDSTRPYRSRFYVFTGAPAGTVTIFNATTADANAGTSAFSIDYVPSTSFVITGPGTAATVTNIQANKWYSIETKYVNGAALTATVQGAGATTPTDVTSATPASGGTIESASMGSQDGVAVSGSMSFDEFDSTRAELTPIGRLCRGDANGSGGTPAINIFDRVTVQNEIFGTAIAAGQPDCTEDGAVNIFDRVCVQNIIFAGGNCP